MTHTTPLRQRMIEDMDLAGLRPSTQQTYILAVRKLAGRFRRSPDQITEKEVRAYLIEMKTQGAALGTFKTNFHGIRFLFRNTLECDWALFSKKRFASPNRSAFHKPFPIMMRAAC